MAIGPKHVEFAHKDSNIAKQWATIPRPCTVADIYPMKGDENLQMT